MTEVEQPPAADLEGLLDLQARAQDLARKSRAAATWKSYGSDMTDFREWCAVQNPVLDSLPATPLTVALYLTWLADRRKPSTIRRRLASISVAHQLAGLPTPTGDASVRAVWAGIRRTKGVAPRKVGAARTKVIRQILDPFGDRTADHRDRALLLIGFAGAFRRSELVSLDVADITEDDAGLRIRLGRSKTDPDGTGALIGIPHGSHPPTCPVRAWRTWKATAQLEHGPAFRGVDRHGQIRTTRLSDRAVADMIRRRALAAGVDGTFSGHSLRAGNATEGYAQGTPELAIMRGGRWASAAVMRGYVEEGGLWNDNAAGRLGL